MLARQKEKQANCSKEARSNKDCFPIKQRSLAEELEINEFPGVRQGFVNSNFSSAL